MGGKLQERGAVSTAWLRDERVFNLTQLFHNPQRDSLRTRRQNVYVHVHTRHIFIHAHTHTRSQTPGDLGGQVSFTVLDAPFELPSLSRNTHL